MIYPFALFITQDIWYNILIPTDILLQKGDETLDIKVGDRLLMKKPHPCGCFTFSVKRVGMDFKIVCEGCSHEVYIPRSKVEKNIKKIITEE